MWCIIFSSYGLAFWYGVHLIMDDRQACLDDVGRCLVRYDSASLLVVFLSVLMGTSTGKEVVHLDLHRKYRNQLNGRHAPGYVNCSDRICVSLHAVQTLRTQIFFSKIHAT